ncbi:velvet factor-domain-containing protein [Pyrenochaeta sp. MPI-SDFR-AT-0127]|nr:velvet factor-domain-containing protein [Pyrenochaeta sp. MPI-SDFR-AT-0127]
MYSHSRQANQYPVAAPQPPRPDGAPLPPPVHLHDSSSMMHLQPQSLPPHAQQQQQQQQHPQPPQQTPSSNGLTYHVGDNPGDFVGQREGRTYRLRFEQQPVRARMCGFGDKDRRPITPPPCIRLIVCDSKTGQEIDFNDVDSTFFVLSVDLWHEDTSRAVNLVRHSSAAPTVSISSSTVTSYPPPPERPMYIPTPMVPQYNQYGQPIPPRAVDPYSHPSMPPNYYGSAPGSAGYPPYGAGSAYGQNPVQMPVAVAAPPINQNHTRNLIGMNAVNACRLNDPEGKTGFWFVLQDLSVRTEGTFRLKISMCDIGTGQGTNAVVSTGKCPILASSFSAPFTVYSAKKFPGVIESTPLSKCFAQQGIKIPIRKDGPKNLSNQAEYDADDM